MQPTLLLDGLRFTECPRWHDGKLWFSDIHARRVMTVDEQGNAETVHQFGDDVVPAGLGFLPDGSLLVVNMARPVVLRRDPNGLVSEHADLTGLVKGPLNDMAVDRHGRAYLGGSGTGDFNFDVRPAKPDGNIVRVDPDGSTHVEAEEVDAPNGPCITADDKHYIVSLLFAGKLIGFDRQPDGSLTNRRVWADMKPGGSDGITVDRENAVWACEPLAQQVRRVREGGEVTDVITIKDKMPIVPCLGGHDGRTLFILSTVGGPPAIMSQTCTSVIETVRVDIPGLVIPVTTQLNLEWMVSVDDHVLEPPDLWTSRLAAKFLEDAPRLVVENGVEVWMYEGKRNPTNGLAACAGKTRQEFSPEPVTYAEMRPGCYDPRERVKDMNLAGILASLNFPSFPRFAGQRFSLGADKELGMACIQAYNDWMLDDWCAAAPGRFIPMIIIPFWDPRRAVAEIERNAAKGNHSICFSENPEPLGFPTINAVDRYWDPVWQACEETDTVVSIHIGSSSQPLRFSSTSTMVMDLAWGTGGRVSGTMLEWIFSPTLDRFPKLQIALSEGGIGWIPYFLETAQRVVGKQQYWASRADVDLDLVSSEAVFDTSKALDFTDFDVRARFRQHMHGCFFSDIHGLKNAREIGIDNIMLESDYPHSDSSWPGSIKQAHAEFAETDLTEEEQYKILRGNAERLYSFTSADPDTIDT